VGFANKGQGNLPLISQSLEDIPFDGQQTQRKKPKNGKWKKT